MSDNRSAKRGVIYRMMHRVESISQTNALLWGVAWLIISSICGWYLCLAPQDVVGYDVVGYMPLVHSLMLNCVVWIAMASVVYVVMLILNRRAKLVDSYARLLFAHWPVTLMLLPVWVVGKVKYAMFVNDFTTLLSVDALTAVLMALYSVAIVLWMLYWSYTAFRRGVGRDDWSVWCSFIVGYYLASKFTAWVLSVVYQGVIVG